MNFNIKACYLNKESRNKWENEKKSKNKYIGINFVLISGSLFIPWNMSINMLWSQPSLRYSRSDSKTEKNKVHLRLLPPSFMLLLTVKKDFSWTNSWVWTWTWHCWVEIGLSHVFETFHCCWDNNSSTRENQILNQEVLCAHSSESL